MGIKKVQLPKSASPGYEKTPFNTIELVTYQNLEYVLATRMTVNMKLPMAKKINYAIPVDSEFANGTRVWLNFFFADYVKKKNLMVTVVMHLFQSMM